MSTVIQDRAPAGTARPRDVPAADPVRTALAALAPIRLHALRAVAAAPTTIAPELMLWLEHATAWESDRRAGLHYALHAPSDLVGAAHLSASILALAALSRRFGGEDPQAALLFAAIGAALFRGVALH